MRPRGDAGVGRLLNDIHLDEVTRPEDPRLGDLADFLQRTFADPNSVLGLDRIQQFLSEPAVDAARHFHVLAAEGIEQPSRVVGTTIFSYVVRSNCGFSEYLAVDASLRQRRLGRALFERRRAILDVDAIRYGSPMCNGVFIEVDSPWRTPPSLLALESVDPIERLRVFKHFGFQRVAVAYVQPPLAPDKLAVDHMDLLFVPSGDARDRDAIPAEWLFDTLAAIWSAWTPETFSTYLSELQGHVTTAAVALVDPLSPS